MEKLLLLFLGVASIACTEITFNEAQPKGIKSLTEFPLSLQGSYVVPMDSGTENHDTLYVEATRYRINTILRDGNWEDSGVLSDSLVLKVYKEYYFLNFFSDEQWIVRVFKQEKNGSILIYEINLSDDEKLKVLRKEFNPEVIQKDNSTTYYRINPSPKNLLNFIKENFLAQEPLQKVR